MADVDVQAVAREMRNYGMAGVTLVADSAVVGILTTRGVAVLVWSDGTARLISPHLDVDDIYTVTTGDAEDLRLLFREALRMG